MEEAIYHKDSSTLQAHFENILCCSICESKSFTDLDNNDALSSRILIRPCLFRQTVLDLN